VNVTGTLNVLEFICSVKTKILFHASTIVANGSVDEEKRLSESWPSPDEFDEMPNLAYPISKFVCDRLMAKAVERGLPVKVFRFPVVGGDSTSGANVNYDNNQLMLRLMGYMSFKSMPCLPIPFFILPVDVCSDVSLTIFFNDLTPYEIYNIYNPNTCNEIDFVTVAEELGYSVEIEDSDKFKEKLSYLISNSKLTHSLKIWSDDDDVENRLLNPGGSTAVVVAWTSNPRDAFFSPKLSKFISNYPEHFEHALSIIRRDLNYAKETGLFKSLGI
jgi:thioester reductase-like protein